MSLDIKKHDKKTSSKYLASDKIRTTIWIEIDKRNRLKVLAAQHNKTITALIDEGLDMVIKKYL